VDAIGFSATAPFRRGGRRVWLPHDGEDVFRGVDAAEVSDGWFRAAGLTTLRGRTYSGADLRFGNVAVVNEAFVQRHRLEEPVVGTVLRVDSIPTVRSITQMVDDTTRRIESVTIIGVVSNGLTRPLIPEPIPALYLPLRGIPDYVSVYVRTAAPVAIQGRIPQLMAAIDPDLPAVSIATLADRFDEDAGDVRLLASAASGLGLSALALALAGVYSVVAFFVSLRTHEFGIRLAIGARPADIVRMVVLQASQLVGIGSIIGLVIGSPVLIGLSKAFPYTSAFDPIGLLVPLFGLMAAAVVAAIAPARRAARVDPCSALRSE
jgi:ABC-type antimicrobial peptide transport system permease subunit